MKKPEIVFQARRFKIERVVQVCPNGEEHIREIVRHPGAVVILPFLDDGRVVLVRNYRVAVDETLIELPAGTLDYSSDSRLTAERELAEETGYRAGNMRHLLTFCMSPGILDEKMHLYLATSLTPGEMAPEPGEEIQPFLCTWEEVLTFIRRGEIRDAKSLVGLLYYERFLR
ncbi:MAG TPA: NUDIX hydrolase [Thermoguttaceae bacterium]